VKPMAAPLHFELNQGQTDPEVKFVARSRGATIFLTPQGPILRVHHDQAEPQAERLVNQRVSSLPGSSWRSSRDLGLRFLNANLCPSLSGLERLSGKVHYFKGNDPANWLTDVPAYAKVQYQGVYPGIDLVLRGSEEGQLEFDCIVAPGADASAIAFRLDGAERTQIDALGNLVVDGPSGQLSLRAPLVYQMVNGQRREICARFVEREFSQLSLSWSEELAEPPCYGFEVAAYDSAQPLVIDPILSFATFLGGSGFEAASGVAVDSAGDVYVVGRTETGFQPLNPVNPEPAHTVNGDAFVVKLKSDGSGFLYAVYLGGSSGAAATGVAIDSAGNACIIGDTWSSDFPLVKPIQPNHRGGGTDAFVVKLNAEGNAILYSTFLGGSGADGGRRIAVDASDSAYVTGITTSDDFPTTAGAFQPRRSGGVDAFVTKINAAGSAILYSTFLGGTGDEFSYNNPTIAVDPAGNAYVAGVTASTNFPTTVGTFQTRYGGGSSDAFVTKLNPSGSALVYSTYLGGGSYEEVGQSCAVDQHGVVYVAGDSGSPDFPLAPGPFSTRPNYPALLTKGGGLFVSKLSSDGSSLVYSTRIPGQHCYGLAVDPAGSAWVTGDASAQDANVVFPSTNPIQAGYGGGGSDAFILKVAPDGDQLQFSSYYGGSDGEVAFGIATDPKGDVYVAGQTSSASFPTTNAVQVAFGGGADAFVLKVSDPDLTPPIILAAGNYGDSNIVTIDFSESLAVASATNAANYRMDRGVAVNSVSLGVNSRSVRLLTSGLDYGTAYTLTVNGVLDRAPVANMIAPDTHVTFTALRLFRGFLHQEIYEGIGLAGSLVELTNNVKFPDHPDSVTDIHQAEILSGAYYQDGVRLSGWLLPPVTGEYTFFLCSGSQAALLLSRNESPLNEVQVAFEPWGFGNGGGTVRQWNHPVPGFFDSPLPNVSLPIHLEAGQVYYVEVQAASSSTDVLGLAWQPPGAPVPNTFDPPISGAYLAVLANPKAAALTIVQQPQSASVAEGQTASFAVQATASPPNIFYQWRKNGAELPGENGPSLVIAETQLSENGNSYDCVLAIPGATVTSGAANLTVTKDITPPTLLSAEGNISSGHVTVTFSKPISAGDATNTVNYLLSGGLTVSTGVLLADRRTVVLTTSPQAPGSNYTVQVSGIRDLSTSGNSVAAGTQAPFFGWMDEEYVGPFPSWANVKEVYGAVGDGVADDTDALQKALDEVASPGHAAVIYFPVGTYRITRTLIFFGRLSASLVGEDPVNTIIKWDGAADGDLMFADGVTASRWTRLTWDGSSKGRVAVHHGYTGGWQVTGNLHTDEIFKDLAAGLLVDPVNGGDSHTIIRCHFLRCSTEGIATSSYNAIDWHIWDSVFEDCQYGLISYTGNFHVYRSLFLRSTEMDIFSGTGYTGIRGNTSIGSRAFTDNRINYQATVQGNTIIDSLDPTPIHWPAGGSMILLDNTIVSRTDVTNGPVAKIGDNLTSAGNTFTVANPVAVGGRAMTMDDRVVSRDSVGLPPVMIPRFLPKSASPVIEVVAGANAATIQQAIDTAGAMNGVRAIVHLPTGDYYLDRTLLIPANCDLQLVGDGFIGHATTLHGNSTMTGAAIRLVGPSRATLRDFHLVGVSQGTGIAVENCDQPRARVFLEHVWVYNSTINNLVVDRLDNTDVSLQDLSHGASAGVSLRVIGGAAQAAGQLTAGRVNLFGGGAGGGNLAYQVEHGGRLLVEDCWFEGAETGFFQFTDSGAFTLNNAEIAAGDPNHGGPGVGMAEIGDFHGAVSLLNTTFTHTRAVVSGDGSGTDVLLLGCAGLDVSGATNGLTYLDNQSPNAHVEHLMSSSSGLEIPNVGDGSSVFMRQMLSQLRAETPRRLVPLPLGVTDVRMYGVSIEACRVGIKLTGVNTPPQLVPMPSQFVITEGSTFTVTNQVTDPDLPFDSFTFELGPGAPSGVSLNPTNGVLTWVPIESDGPSTYTVHIIIGDAGSPRLFVTNTLTVTVLESNLPPTLGVVGVVTNVALEGLVNITTAIPHPARLQPSWDLLGNGDVDIFAGGNQLQVYDDGAFAFQRVSGDFDVSVRLASMEALRPETCAGLMVRETLDDFSRTLHVLAHPAGITQDGRVGPGYFFTLQRAVAGGPVDRWDSGYGSGTVTVPHAWMRLRRQEQNFTASWSDDGTNWTRISQHAAIPPYPRELFVGLAVASGHTEYNAHFEFRGYRNLVSTLMPIPDLTTGEGESLSIAVRASDPDSPLQTLAFSLNQEAPDGASIDPSTGVFTWKPNESQGLGTYPITVRVTDNGQPPLNEQQTFTVTVTEGNTAPQLKAITDQTAIEGQPFTLTVTVIDTDFPTNRLAFTLAPNLPAGMSIHPSTGVITWIPDETQGGASFPVTVTVSDDGLPPLSDSKSFAVSVDEANSPPVLAALSDVTIDELTDLSFIATATDPDRPAQPLTFSLGQNSLAGATISPDGVFHWRPSEDQGPGVYPLAVIVNDNGVPALSDSKIFTVTVNEVNLPPVLAPIADRNAEATCELTFTATATDSDLPLNLLTFILETGAPDGATIDFVTGVFRWTPAAAQAPSTNSIGVRVTDNGIPLLSDSKAFQVIVFGPPLELRIIGTPTVVNGQFSFTWQAQAGQSYRVQFKASLDPAVPWKDTPTLITAGGPTATYQESSTQNAPQRFFRVRSEQN
jgi:hypothetical protein